MTEFSHFSRLGLVTLSLGIGTACQNEPPAFYEQSMLPIAVSVTEGGSGNEPLDNVFTIDEDEPEAMTEGPESDPVRFEADRPDRYAGYYDESDDVEIDGPQDFESQNRHSADQDVEPGATPPASDSGYSMGKDDAKAVAKDCSKYFKGQASKLVVLSAGETSPPLNLGPNTVLALRLAGNQPSIHLNLNGTQALAGLCIVLRGHESSVQLSSSNPLHKLVYLASGDQSLGTIHLNAGVDSSYIELGGHAPSLSLRGVDQSACDSARLRNHSAKIRCTP